MTIQSTARRTPESAIERLMDHSVPYELIRSEPAIRSENPTAKCDKPKTADNSAHCDHKARLKQSVSTGQEEAERTDGSRTGDQPDQREPTTFPLCSEPVDAIRGVEGEPAMQLVRQDGAQDSTHSVRDQRAVTAQCQESGEVENVAGSADEGKTNKLSKGAVSGKGAKPRCRKTRAPRTHHRDRIAPDPDVRRAHIGFSHTDNRNHTFRLVI